MSDHAKCKAKTSKSIGIIVAAIAIASIVSIGTEIAVIANAGLMVIAVGITSTLILVVSIVMGWFFSRALGSCEDLRKGK